MGQIEQKKQRSVKADISSNWKVLLTKKKQTQKKKKAVKKVIKKQLINPESSSTSPIQEENTKNEQNFEEQPKKIPKLTDEEEEEPNMQSEKLMSLRIIDTLSLSKYDINEDEEEEKIDLESGLTIRKRARIDEQDDSNPAVLQALMKLDGADQDDPLIKQKIGKYIAIDCEMVGIGPNGHKSALARVTAVNYYGYVLLDEFVKPKEKVVDYRTQYSGITKELLKNAKDFDVVQVQVQDLIEGKTIIGHSVKSDLKALSISHPNKLIRDTAYYNPHKTFYVSFMAKTQPDKVIPRKFAPSLKFLSKEILGIEIQNNEAGHSSVEDARVAMLLYRRVRKEWEDFGARKEINKKHSKE